MQRRSKKIITHIITGLSAGGAETVLYKVLKALQNEQFEFRVVSLTNFDPIGRKIQELGIPVTALGMRRGRLNPKILIKLATLLKQPKPDLVQTWMYHADLIGGVVAKTLRNVPLVWNIRHSNLDKKSNKRSTLLIALICAKLSGRLPVKIICCAEKSKKIHVTLGYDYKKIVVIPNGFDVTHFTPNQESKHEVRKELGLPLSTRLIGMIARFHPQKDHENFIKAAAAFNKSQPDVHFVLCGENIKWTNSKLCKLIKKDSLQKNFHLLGVREDVDRITASLDIATLSSSSGEGFPNVIGEAMCCGIPCVVTDVGDSAYIVGDTGVVVPPQDPYALAKGWEQLLSLPLKQRIRLGKRARRRITKNFDLQLMAKKYEKLWLSTIRN